MPYLGNPPAERFTSFDYQDLTGGSGTSFTLDNPVGNPQEIEVFVNNVRQEPGVAYTVSGTALTMTGSVASTDDFYVVFQGKAIQTATHPSDRALTATDGTFTGDISGQGLSVSSADVNGASILGAPGTFYVGDDGGSVGAFLNQTASLPLRLMTSGSERLRVLSGGGLTFNGDTAAANALDDYEEGTFTPTFVAGATVTSYTAQSGRYTKIGRQVMVEVDLDINVGSATSAHIYVGPMPFTSSSSAPYGGGYFVYNGGFYNSLGQWLMFAGSTSAAFYRQSDGAALGGTSTGINIGGNCRFVLFYVAA